MKKPNFFIIGAPKCGTTSLAAYLAQHPDIFFSYPKEPTFFNTDSPFHIVRNLARYNALFKKAGPQHKAVGEGSAKYLFSKQAVSNILSYNPAAKFIVMLRNPVDMVYSWHSQLLYGRWQPIADFRVAWQLQEELAKNQKEKHGSFFDSRKFDSRFFLYGEIGKLGEHVEQLYKIVPKDRVLIILFDDLKTDPKKVYEETLSFLGVSSDNREDFPIYNENKVDRHSWLKGLLFFVGIIKMNLNFWHSTGLLKPLWNYNRIKVKRSSLPEDLRAELVDYFREDVEKLSRLIYRDLSHWK